MSLATTTPITLDEFVRRYSGESVEVIDGKVEPLPMPGAKHGEVCINVALIVGGYIKQHKLGLVCGNDTFVLIRKEPLRVRGADLVFWSRETWSADEVPAGVIEVPPDLVIEVRSPSDRLNTVIAKATEYVDAGTRVVVVIDPKNESAAVHQGDEFPRVLHNGDELTLPDVLPGFSVPVKRFFE